MATKLNSMVRFVIRNTLFVLFLVSCITAFNFPYDVGAPTETDELDESANYYRDVYTPTADGGNDEYIAFGQAAAHDVGVAEDIADFTKRYGLSGAATLEIGAGSGTLQDLTENYTGLDIASSAERFFHKPFVEGSATQLPFEDNTFDVIWTVWTLEHVPNPELALTEIRRVLKDGGHLYLRPAWNNPTGASAPFIGVPFNELRLLDKLRLVGILAQNQPLYHTAYRIPIRLLRLSASLLGGPTRLHYNGMTPNYSRFAIADADAVNSIDCYEAQLWFATRGDTILENSSSASQLMSDCTEAVLVRIHK